PRPVRAQPRRPGRRLPDPGRRPDGGLRLDLLPDRSAAHRRPPRTVARRGPRVPAGHRFAGARHPLDDRARRAGDPADRPVRLGGRHADRGQRRCRRRLFRRLGRRNRHARGRTVPDHPEPDLRAHHRGHPGLDPDQHRDRHRHRELDADRPHDPGGVPVVARPRVRAGLPIHGHERLPHHRFGDPAQRPAAGDRAVVARGRGRHPVRIGGLLPRPRRSQRRKLGPAGRRRAAAHPQLVVHLRHPGHRHHDHRALPQPGGRRAERRAQPQAPGSLSDGHPPTRSARPAHHAVHAPRRDEGGRRAEPHRRRRRDRRHRGRIGLRQVAVGVVDHAAAARSAGPHRRRRGEAERTRHRRAARRGHARHPGQGDRHDLPGSDQFAEPGGHGREADRRSADDPHRPRPRPGARAGARVAGADCPPLLSTLSAALLTAGAASAQTMEFACPDPGTTFTYDSGVKVVARGRSGMDCNMERVGGGPFKLRALLFDNPSADGNDATAFIAALRPERLWPLEAGKKIEASYKIGGGTWTYTLAVVRFERRTGPGDKMIDTFLIEMNETGDKGQALDLALNAAWSADRSQQDILEDRNTTGRRRRRTAHCGNSP
ncbi:hypothetical protein OSTOST_13957, partial [Ostertagia ostertagi]